jgi:formylaminopyrimidine deformylase / aminopyrimidine aminohydrolase
VLEVHLAGDNYSNVLWKVYLDAWRHAASLLKTGKEKSAVSSFAENWTSPEFEQFVHDLTNLVNGLQILPGSEGWKRAESIWARIVELEEMFWPMEGEETTMRLDE